MSWRSESTLRRSCSTISCIVCNFSSASARTASVWKINFQDYQLWLSRSDESLLNIYFQHEICCFQKDIDMNLVWQPSMAHKDLTRPITRRSPLYIWWGKYGALGHRKGIKKSGRKSVPRSSPTSDVLFRTLHIFSHRSWKKKSSRAFCAWGAKNLRSVDRALSKYPGAKLPERPWSCSATTAKSRRIHPSTWLGMVNKWTAGCVNSPPLSKVAEIRNHAT